MIKGGAELKRTTSTFHSRFESSRALVERAREAAARAVEAADAMRARLYSDHDHDGPATPEPDLWEAAAREILDGSREQDRTLGLLSRELGQTLTAAIAAGRLLQVTEDHDAADRARAVLQDRLEQLSRLVADLLEFSRASLEPVSTALCEVNLDEVIARSAGTVEPVIAERAQHLTIAKASAPPIVRGDPARLEQMFSSLLHTASRNTPPGGHVEINSFVEPDWTRVDVHGGAIGIDASPAAVREPRTQRPAENSDAAMPFSLARRVAELHGGTITAQAGGRGRGSTFCVRLPALAHS